MCEEKNSGGYVTGTSCLLEPKIYRKKEKLRTSLKLVKKHREKFKRHLKMRVFRLETVKSTGE
jgi:hypothetical protein